MAYYVKSIDVPGSLEESFDYVADFANATDWDPRIVEAKKLTKGLLDVGTEFRVLASSLGRKLELVYRITKFEPPKRLVLEADTPDLRLVDTLSFEPERAGTRISYHAEVQLKGLRRFADPLLQLAFAWIAYDAIRGLQRKLGRLAAGSKPRRP